MGKFSNLKLVYSNSSRRFYLKVLQVKAEYVIVKLLIEKQLLHSSVIMYMLFFHKQRFYK